MSRLLLVVLVCLLLPACSNSTHIRTAIGEVTPAQVNLGRWQFTRSLRPIQLQWAIIRSPVWMRRTDDGGWYAVGFVIDRGTGGIVLDASAGMSEYRPGRTHLVAMAYDAQGRVRPPTNELRADLDAMVQELRRVAW